MSGNIRNTRVYQRGSMCIDYQEIQTNAGWDPVGYIVTGKGWTKQFDPNVQGLADAKKFADAEEKNP